MSSTIITDKCVAAFQSDTEIIYLLFIETYDSNVFPQTPRWNCCAIGSYDEVLLYIHLMMSSCEGGTTKYRRGDIKPENLLKTWLKLFQAPVSMPDVSVALDLTVLLKTDHGRTEVEKVCACLTARGLPELAEQAMQQPLQLSLHKDAAAITAIFGVNGTLSPWRAVCREDAYTLPDKELAPAREKLFVGWPSLEVMKVEDRHYNDFVLVKAEDGCWRSVQAVYSAVQHFISHYGYQMELRSTGSSVQYITRFRDQITSAKAVQDHIKLKIYPDRTNGYTWSEKLAFELLNKLGIAKPADGAAAPRVTTTLGDVRECDGMYELSRLQPDQVEWEIGDDHIDLLPGLGWTTGKQAGQQLSLL